MCLPYNIRREITEVLLGECRQVKQASHPLRWPRRFLPSPALETSQESRVLPCVLVFALLLFDDHICYFVARKCHLVAHPSRPVLKYTGRP